MSKRLDSLNDSSVTQGTGPAKKPALKFKPKQVARRSADERTTAQIKTPSTNKLNAKKSTLGNKIIKKQRDNNNGDVIVSAGPLAQGAISLGASKYQNTSSFNSSGSSNVVHSNYIKKENINEGDDGTLSVDVNNPALAKEHLFPLIPNRLKTEEDKSVSTDSDSSREQTPNFESVEDSQLQTDYNYIREALVNSSLDASGDVKMEEEDLPQKEEPQFLFLQLPEKLPELNTINNIKEEPKSGDNNDDTNENNNSPEGQIGEFQIHKSGKVSLKIGNVIFDISRGGETNWDQSIWALDSVNEDCWNLGDVKQRIVGTPTI